MAVVSQNGWPVDPYRSARTIPGSSVRVTVADGPAGDVLMHVLARFDHEVEDIDMKSTRGEFDDWGYANRNVRGSTMVSNHASATAVDVNATRHPLGAVGTFSRQQVDRIHAILLEVDNVVRWGGDYVGRRDEMHFEIVGTEQQVAAVAANLAGGFLMTLSAQQQSVVFQAALRSLGMLQQRYYVRTPAGGVRQVAAGTPGAIPCGVLDTLDGNYLVAKLLETRAELTLLRGELQQLRGETVDETELRAAVDAELREFMAEWEQISARPPVDDQEVRG
jgi:hypothetical protein